MPSLPMPVNERPLNVGITVFSQSSSSSVNEVSEEEERGEGSGEEKVERRGETG